MSDNKCTCEKGKCCRHIFAFVLKYANESSTSI
ncbi:MAG: hypothetical protein ACP6IU_11735 [Candidatus Asgardarchaeia archaeon]